MASSAAPDPTATSRFHVDAEIRNAESLPPEAYSSKRVAEHEQERLFQRTWLIVPGLDARALAPNERIPFQLANRPYFVQRTAGGELVAFPNVCTHAWHTLVHERSRGETLVCPQHGRRFDSLGRFLAQPGMPTHIGVPRACDHLKPLSVRTWGPLTFVCVGEPPHRSTPETHTTETGTTEDKTPDADANQTNTRGSNPNATGRMVSNAAIVRRAEPHAVETQTAHGHMHADSPLPLDQLLAPIRARLGTYDLDALPNEPEIHTQRTLDGNWKLHAANYLDSLHIPFIHGASLARTLVIDSYETTVGEHIVLQTADAKDPALAFPAETGVGEGRTFALWWFLWPNAALNVYPWGVSLNLYEPALDPQKTVFHWVRWRWPSHEDADIEAWHMSDVDEEDVMALARVANGLRSGHAVRGRFVPDKEQAVHWFHHRVSAAIRSSTRTDDL